MTRAHADAIVHACHVQGATIEQILRLSKQRPEHIEQVLEAEADYERRQAQ